MIQPRTTSQIVLVVDKVLLGLNWLRLFLVVDKLLLVVDKLLLGLNWLLLIPLILSGLSLIVDKVLNMFLMVLVLAEPYEF